MITQKHFKQLICLMLLTLSGLSIAQAFDSELRSSILSGKTEDVRELLEKGANPNTHISRDTPLYTAIKTGKKDIAALLIQYGADVNAPTCLEKSILNEFIRRHDIEAVSFLLEQGATLNNKHISPLFVAATPQNKELADLLMQYGVDPNDDIGDGKTALFLAISRPYANATAFLLDLGADPNHVLSDGNTPLHWACDYNKNEIVQQLIENGASLEVSNNNGDTALHTVLGRLSYEKGTAETVLTLLEHGIDVTATNNNGQTAIEFIFDKPERDVLGLLKHPEILNSLKSSMVGPTWIGVVRALSMWEADLVKALKEYSKPNPEVKVVYVTPEMLDLIGYENFSGFVFPGAGDNYPKNTPSFTLEDMPEDRRTQVDKYYQHIYEHAYALGIPTFGVCAGAQHLALHRGASLTKSTTESKSTELAPYHVPHFLSLTPEERKAVLETCDAQGVNLKEIYRAHSYAALSETLEPNGLTLAASDEETPLAFYEGFEALATQFHPERAYDNDNSFIGWLLNTESTQRQTNLINGFVELCQGYRDWINWAQSKGYSQSKAVAMRKAELQIILDRLEECRINDNVQPMSWAGSVTLDQKKEFADVDWFNYLKHLLNY